MLALSGRVSDRYVEVQIVEEALLVRNVGGHEGQVGLGAEARHEGERKPHIRIGLAGLGAATAAGGDQRRGDRDQQQRARPAASAQRAKGGQRTSETERGGGHGHTPAERG